MEDEQVPMFYFSYKLQIQDEYLLPSKNFSNFIKGSRLTRLRYNNLNREHNNLGLKISLLFG